MPSDYQSDSGNGTGRLDRIEHILELVAKNQLAMQEHHDDEFKKLMTWQVLTQDRVDRIDRQIEALGAKIDRQVELQAGFDARVDKLVAAIGEFIRRPDARV